VNKPARILMYSQDSYGLGHLRRSTNFANALVTERTDLSVLLVVDSPVAPFFDLQEHIDFVKLPTVVKVDAGVFRPGRLLTTYALVKAMRSTVNREVLARFRPDVILVDHMPGGANRELVPALKLLRSLHRSTRIVLGVRDIIDDPAVTCAVWQREGFYETLRRYYDAVLIYGAADVFPTAAKYEIDRALPGQVRYCGYVCNMDPVEDADYVRAKLDLSSDPIVVVMAGGGADAFRLMQTYLEALALMDGALRATTVMVTGPFMPEEQRKWIREHAREHDVQVRTSVSDSLSQINAAELVVSMAGYNTVSEILRFRKRAILVPRPGPSAEQRMRATLFSQRGLVTMVDPCELSPRRLAAAIVDTLSKPAPAAAIMPDMHGVDTVTDTLLNWVSVNGGATKSCHDKRSCHDRRGLTARSNGAAALT
jgi:predicted glycosyltransferase